MGTLESTIIVSFVICAVLTVMVSGATWLIHLNKTKGDVQ